MTETIGKRIARLRTARNWTQQEIAERLAISRVAVSHMEMGLSSPSERSVTLLAGLFRLEPGELVADTSYPTAKAERLPAVACRYTEVELQIALLERDLAWLQRPEALSLRATLGREIIHTWLLTLGGLAANCIDRHEREAIAQGRALLEAVVRSL